MQIKRIHIGHHLHHLQTVKHQVRLQELDVGCVPNFCRFRLSCGLMGGWKRPRLSRWLGCLARSRRSCDGWRLSLRGCWTGDRRRRTCRGGNDWPWFCTPTSLACICRQLHSRFLYYFSLWLITDKSWPLVSFSFFKSCTVEDPMLKAFLYLPMRQTQHFGFYVKSAERSIWLGKLRINLKTLSCFHLTTPFKK